MAVPKNLVPGFLEEWYETIENDKPNNVSRDTFLLERERTRLFGSSWYEMDPTTTLGHHFSNMRLKKVLQCEHSSPHSTQSESPKAGVVVLIHVCGGCQIVLIGLKLGVNACVDMARMRIIRPMAGALPIVGVESQHAGRRHSQELTDPHGTAVNRKSERKNTARSKAKQGN